MNRYAIIFLLYSTITVFAIDYEDSELLLTTQKPTTKTYLQKVYSFLNKQKLSRNMRSLLRDVRRDELKRNKRRVRLRKKQIYMDKFCNNPTTSIPSSSKISFINVPPLNMLKLQAQPSNVENDYDFQNVGNLQGEEERVDANKVPRSSESTPNLPYSSATELALEAMNNLQQLRELNEHFSSSQKISEKTTFSSYWTYPKAQHTTPGEVRQKREYEAIATPSTIQGGPPNYVVKTTVTSFAKNCSVEDDDNCKYNSESERILATYFPDLYESLQPKSLAKASLLPKFPKQETKHKRELVNPALLLLPNSMHQTKEAKLINDYKKVLTPEVVSSLLSALNNIFPNQIPNDNRKLNKIRRSVTTTHSPQITLNKLVSSTSSKPSPSQIITKSLSYLKLKELAEKRARLVADSNSQSNFRREANDLSVGKRNYQGMAKLLHFLKTTEMTVPNTDGPLDSSIAHDFKIQHFEMNPSSKAQKRNQIINRCTQTPICASTTTSHDNTGTSVINPVKTMIEILKMVEDIHEANQKPSENNKNLAEGTSCNITGSWSSIAGGMLLNVTLQPEDEAILDVTLNVKSPPSKKGFLTECGWLLKGLQPIPKTNLIMITGTNQISKRILVFIGECRVCNGEEVVVGNWLSSHISHNCQDQTANQNLLSDVWSREKPTKLRNERIFPKDTQCTAEIRSCTENDDSEKVTDLTLEGGIMEEIECKTTTACPVSTTACPISTTACPNPTTVCPTSTTACPISTTVCPTSTTACSTSTTACPTSIIATTPTDDESYATEDNFLFNEANSTENNPPVKLQSQTSASEISFIEKQEANLLENSPIAKPSSTACTPKKLSTTAKPSKKNAVTLTNDLFTLEKVAHNCALPKTRKTTKRKTVKSTAATTCRVMTKAVTCAKSSSLGCDETSNRTTLSNQTPRKKLRDKVKNLFKHKNRTTTSTTPCGA